MTPLQGLFATSVGGVIGAVVGWVFFDAFAVVPACTTFGCHPARDPVLWGMPGEAFIILCAVGGGLIAFIIQIIKGDIL